MLWLSSREYELTFYRKSTYQVVSIQATHSAPSCLIIGRFVAKTSETSARHRTTPSTPRLSFVQPPQDDWRTTSKSMVHHAQSNNNEPLFAIVAADAAVDDDDDVIKQQDTSVLKTGGELKSNNPPKTVRLRNPTAGKLLHLTVHPGAGIWTLLHHRSYGQLTTLQRSRNRTSSNVCYISGWITQNHAGLQLFKLLFTFTFFIGIRPQR